jgi:type I restriction enzyme, S subunit
MVNGKLSDGWTWADVEDLSKNIQYGYTESANDKPVGPKFLRITDIQDGKVNWDTVPYCECSDEEAGRYLLASGDIVFARTGATTGKSFLITNPPKAVFASYLIRLRLQEAINTKYFSYFLDSPDYWSQIMQVRKGSAQPGVNATILAKLKVPVAPLPEQERIVAKIEELFTQLDAGTSALEKVQAGLRRYKASVLKTAVEGKLGIQNDEGRRGEGGLPQGWRWVTLEEVSLDANYGTSQKCDYEPTKYPVVRIPNIISGSIDLSDLKYAIDGSGLHEKDSLQPGDLLIVRTNGSKDLIGRSAMIRKGLRSPLYFASYLIRYRIKDYDNNGAWISSIWDSPFIRKELESRVATTAGQYNLNIAKLNKLRIPLPPLEEQRQIVAEVERRLSVAREVESAVEGALVRASRLRQAVLKSAFEGNL